ncbi:Tim44 domain-containing protein [Thiosulfativibrio zosterae]|uniref:Tim44-like domain-containing protein n=1 Tax=Thiosulfativibrio zosterae TaxID=2675053 RepID=A0A6F8PKL0_9GAMM|nr:TIM44-like domain-containing protein [Thiosulfativibrio zosterae]BBP42643.1 hypothetical protein THMIRHAT_03890 [Thiosulfativibrio zosterae]
MSQMAQAAKFGGGKSFGYSKQVAPKNFNQPASKPAAQPQAPKNNPATAPAAGQAAKSGASKWLGPLAGLAAGGLLAAMLFGDGFEGFQFMDFLLIALLAFIAFKLFKSFMGRQAQQRQYAGHAPREAYEPEQQQSSYQPQMRETQEHEAYNPHGGSIIGSGLSDAAVPVQDVPAWFDAAGFLEGAKTHYLNIQKAWDAKDLAEIQSYCSAELYEALQGEIANLSSDNYTEVESLDAEIADMAIDGQYFVVSVRYSGFIKEGRFEDAHAFTEIWHIRRNAADEGNWEIAGIQPEVRDGAGI